MKRLRNLKRRPKKIVNKQRRQQLKKLPTSKLKNLKKKPRS